MECEKKELNEFCITVTTSQDEIDRYAEDLDAKQGHSLERKKSDILRLYRQKCIESLFEAHFTAHSIHDSVKFLKVTATHKGHNPLDDMQTIKEKCKETSFEYYHCEEHLPPSTERPPSRVKILAGDYEKKIETRRKKIALSQEAYI